MFYRLLKYIKDRVVRHEAYKASAENMPSGEEVVLRYLHVLNMMNENARHQVEPKSEYYRGRLEELAWMLKERKV